MKNTTMPPRIDLGLFFLRLTGSLLLGDMNAVMGCVLLVGVIFVMLNLLSDMLYQLFDPRTKS